VDSLAWAIAAALLTLLGGVSFAAGGGDAAPEVALRFEMRSLPHASRNLAALRAEVTESTVRVLEPYEGGEATFVALPLERVLDTVYGPSWREEEELLFTCRDGYQPTVPVARVLRHRAWLAFGRVGEPGFTIRKRESGEEKRVEVGPFYVVWENLDDPLILQEADYGWPYQVIAIDLIRTRDRFPRMSPPRDAPADVAAGFAAFRIHCSKCHRLNGEGGRVGPELNAAAQPVRYRDRDWLRQWIEDPASILPGARMPRLNPALPERARTIDEILAYLSTMAESDAVTREGDATHAH